MRREAQRLQDILDAIATIERYASLGRQAFDNQELIQIWIVHHLQIIGEATNALSSELTGRYSQVPWAQIVAFSFLRRQPRAIFVLKLASGWIGGLT
jgi:uncharacterized protein with HEPN domain